MYAFVRAAVCMHLNARMAGNAPASALPVGGSLFDGISIVQCCMTEKDILALLADTSKIREQMGVAVKEIMHTVLQNPAQRATWSRCHPSNGGHSVSLYEAAQSRDGCIAFAPSPESIAIMDSEKWLPELSANGFVGLFHHWHTGENGNFLCLYMACQSYLPAACLEFADLVGDMGDACTAATVVMSEETHWLRRASSRNRARIIAQVCSRMKIPIHTMIDHNACDPKDTNVALCTTETHHNDMYIHTADNSVRFLNYVAGTSVACNGIVCAQAPAYGLVVFHGLCGGRFQADFGSSYGSQFMPTAMPRLQQQVQNQCALSFTTSNPGHCTALQTWGVPADTSAIMHEHVHAAVLQNKTLCTPGDTYTKPLSDDLDPDIIEAFQHVLKFGLHKHEDHAPESDTLLQTHMIMNEMVLQAMMKLGWQRPHGYTILSPVSVSYATMCPKPID